MQFATHRRVRVTARSRRNGPPATERQFGTEMAAPVLKLRTPTGTGADRSTKSANGSRAIRRGSCSTRPGARECFTTKWGPVSFALKIVNKAGLRAVKAQDELATLGLDGGPRRPS